MHLGPSSFIHILLPSSITCFVSLLIACSPTLSQYLLHFGVLTFLAFRLLVSRGALTVFILALLRAPNSAQH